MNVTGRLQVRLGELNMKSNGEPLDHQDRAILDYKIHPKFDNFTKENDIALLKIDETGLQFQARNFNQTIKVFSNNLYFCQTLYQFVYPNLRTTWWVQKLGLLDGVKFRRQGTRN